MAHALVSSLLDQLKSIAQDQVKEKWRLVTGVEQQVGKLTTTLQAIQAVLEDAEQRQMKQDKAVTFWLDQLRDASYDMEDVLEEWITETRKLQLDEQGDDDDDDNDSAFVTFLTKAGEQDYENDKFSRRIAKMFCWLTLKTLWRTLG